MGHEGVDQHFNFPQVLPFPTAMIKELYQAFLSSKGISTDTRTIVPGSIFIALKGEHFDANDMVGAALEKGAAAVVTTNTDFGGRSDAFVVDDTLRTLQLLATEHRQHLTCPVVGITGTNGKTTTKELVTAVLSKKYNVCATKGNLNNHIGVPLTILSIPTNCPMAVVEMGASHPSEIEQLAAIAQPTSGLITNVGMAHILGFGSFEGVKRTKAELYAQLKKTHGTIFLDTHNEHLVGMLGTYDNVVPYVEGSVTEASELLTMQWTQPKTESAELDQQTYELHTHLAGRYNRVNVLAAATVGLFYGVEPELINQAIEAYVPTNSRSQVQQTQRNRLVVDAYNANPSSMEAALDNLQESTAEHKAVILGAMRELGAEQDPQHIKVLQRLAAMNANKNLDNAILIGPEFGKFKAQYPKFLFFDQTAEARDAAAALQGKYILVKGSNSNKLTQLIDVL